MKVAFRIQHHPSRAHLLSELLSALPDAVVVPDEVSPHSGYLKCLADLPPAVTHVCVLQDDVLLARNFAQTVERVVEARPENVVSLFVGGLPGPSRTDFYRAIQEGRRFSPVNSTRICHVVALVWPRALAENFLAWSDENKVPGPVPPKSDDAAVCWWSLRTGNQILATVPCLVEHPDLESVVNPRRAKAGRDKGRTAIHFAGENDPLSYCWR